MKLTKGQLNFLSWEFGVFFHFGIRSFNPGRKDWDGVEMELSIFTIRSPKLAVEIVDSDGEHQITEIKGYFAK